MLKIFSKAPRPALPARPPASDDPFADPAVRRMTPAELADLPFPRPTPTDAAATEGSCHT